MGFLEDTKPSDYDLSAMWAGTIGKYELECDAWKITKYCQEHGDRWQPVLIQYPEWHYPRTRWEKMRESWLERLQRVRVRLCGPPELIRGPHCLQLRWPEGRIRAASSYYTPEQIRIFETVINGD